MLNSSTMIIVNILLNLRLLLSVSWLIDWHFDVFIVISNHNWFQRRILCMDYWIVNSPKPVPSKSFFVVSCYGFHLFNSLVSYNMINFLKFDWSCDGVDGVLEMMWLETWQEYSFIAVSLNERMDGVSISFHLGDDNFSMLIFMFLGWCYWLASILHCVVI